MSGPSFIDETWIAKAHRALKATFDVDKRTKAAMIQFLYDQGFWDPESLAWESAVARFNDCLNPSKSQFFKIGEVWALMMRFGRTQLVEAMAEDLGLEVRPIATEARRQAILERLANVQERLADELAGARADLTRLETPIADPRPAITSERALFSVVAEAGAAAPIRTAVQRDGCP